MSGEDVEMTRTDEAREAHELERIRSRYGAGGFVSAPLRPGEATMHQRLTLHGSRPNLEHDRNECPIVWDRGAVT
jgi:hypothetical protein